MGSSNVEHMHLAFLDGKQHAVTAHNHLTDLFRELIIFRGNRETFGNQAELFDNRCS